MNPRTRRIFLALYLTCALIISGAFGDYNTSTGTLYYDKFSSPQNLPYRKDAATFVKDDTLYSWGGRLADGKTSSQFDSFYLDQNTGELVYKELDVPHNGPDRFITITAGSAAVLLPDNNRVLFFGGDKSTESEAYPGQTMEMHVIQYDFAADEWTYANISNTNETIPRNTESPTATLAPNGNIYIFGGIYTNTSGIEPVDYLGEKMDLPVTMVSSNLTMYNPDTSYFTYLSVPEEAYDALRGIPVALPDGRIVYFDKSSLVAVFDTNTNRTTVLDLELSEKLEDYVKEYEYGFLGPDQRTIYYYGGVYNYGSRVKAHSTFAELNTDSMSWSFPSVLHWETYPRRRYDFIAGFLNSTYLLVGLGRSEYKWFTQFDVLRIANDTDSGTTKFKWVSNVTEPFDFSYPKFPSKFSGGDIAGIVIGSVAFIIIAFIMWKRFDALKAAASVIYGILIWVPRAGEPRWAEISHAINKLVLTFLFVAYLTYNIISVLQSPIAISTFTDTVTEVQFPDVRICAAPASDMFLVAQSQSDQMTEDEFALETTINEIDHFYQYPYTMTDPSGLTSCWVFSPSEEFKIDVNKNGGHGRIKFFFGGEPEQQESNNTRIQIELYPPGRDPNQVVLIHGIQPALTQDEIYQWIDGDVEGAPNANKYTVDHNSYTVISYQIQKHRYLKPTGWNNVGFLQQYDEKMEITTSMQTMDGDSDLSNSIDITPTAMTEVTLQEQKVHTLLSALGTVGGLFSLIVSADSLLFGARPKSPWGVVQRFSRRKARMSLLDNLYNAFGFLGRPIPYIDFVHERFKDSKLHQPNLQPEQNVEDKTMAAETKSEDTVQATTEDPPTRKEFQDLQRRLQLMESMFRAYYIDDEIFQNLSLAHDRVENTNGSEENPLVRSGTSRSIRRKGANRTPLPVHRDYNNSDDEINNSTAENIPLAHV